MAIEPRVLDVAVVGGGLAGSLAACSLARRGHRVRVYEYRSDIRVEESRGQSIDLALSIRGREALRLVDLEDTLINHHGIAMRGRMIHGRDGKLNEMIYDRIGNNCIYSVSRKYLNQVLLNAADDYTNVKLDFNKKLLNADLDNGKLKFLDTTTGETINVEAELIVGADGAYSTVRKTMMKRAGFDFSQTYIEHGYVELTIPAKIVDDAQSEKRQEKKFAMSNRHLHIWPRGHFMMIALPNDDFTFTGNLFAPLDILNDLDTPEKLINFYNNEFPDALPLIGSEKDLIDNFFATKPKTLISIKCKPYHAGSKAVILGDAAHAMVPFYAQGMNAAFEDVLLLDGLMEKYDSDPERCLPAFSDLRCEDAHAICDLAMYNYIEMRDLVNKKSFMLRRGLDTFLHAIWPNGWIPLYNTIHFSRMGFRDCIANRAWQDKIIRRSFWCLGTAASLVLLFVTKITSGSNEN